MEKVKLFSTIVGIYLITISNAQAQEIQCYNDGYGYTRCVQSSSSGVDPSFLLRSPNAQPADHNIAAESYARAQRESQERELRDLEIQRQREALQYERAQRSMDTQVQHNTGTPNIRFLTMEESRRLAEEDGKYFEKQRKAELKKRTARKKAAGKQQSQGESESTSAKKPME